MKKDRILRRDEIYHILITALQDKAPLPPEDWSIVKFDEEVYWGAEEVDPDPLSRQRDALETSLFYLTEFASRMPESVDLSENTPRVKKVCEDLSREIIRMTLHPDEVVKERGKLKIWLKAILSVGTCLIYTEETDRFIAEQEAEKRRKQIARVSQARKDKEKLSSLADMIWKKTQERSGDQPALF